MKTLWAPWRMEHVQGKTKIAYKCLFEPPGNRAYIKKDLLLYRDRLSVVLLNRFPYANGHILVAPRRHLADLTDLSSSENQAIMEVMQECCTILRSCFHPDGINIGMNIGEAAGAGIIDHLHFHIIPRWHGDHNFMCAAAEVRSIPQHLEKTFDILLPGFKKLLLRSKKL